MSKNAPFHFDLVGSLKRPTKLSQSRHAFEAGQLDRAKLKNLQTKEIARVAHEQAKLGFNAVTDGEFARSWWHLDFLWGLTGVDRYDYSKSYKFHGSKTRTDNVHLTGRIAYNPNHPFFEDFKALQANTPEGILAKQTIPSPTMLFRDNRSDLALDFYESWEEYLTDLAQAYHQTILRFYELGCRYLQLDDTTWAFLISKFIDTKHDFQEQAKYRKIAEDAVKVINATLADLPDDLTITTHVCRGNFKSTYLYTGGYEYIASYLGQLNYDGFFLEYDNERSGSFEPLTEIWHNRPNVTIVLGLVTSKFPDLEDPEQLKQRVVAASEYVPLENLALSTQCGFASTEEGNAVTEEEQWKKLALVVQTAQEIWS